MRTSLFLTLLIMLAFNSMFAQELSKEEKKRLREELKIYMSDLNNYKARKDDIQATIDSAEAEIKRLKEQIKDQTEVRSTMDAYEAELSKVKSENEELKNFNSEKVDKMVSALLSEKLDSLMATMPASSGGVNNGGQAYNPSGNSGSSGNNNDGSGSTQPKGKSSKKNKGGTAKPGSSGSSPSGSQAPSSFSSTQVEGTIYKIQIGLYRKFNINKYFEDMKYIGYETVDGKNRYVIGYFNDEQTAHYFVEDIRKMGIKDAFVAKYVDGQRVYEKP